MIFKIMPRYDVRGLKGSLKYIKNENKTLTEEDYINALVSADSITSSLKYIENADKVKSKYISSIKCDVDTAELEFQINNEKVTRKSGNGLQGIMYYHIVQSVPEELSPYISDEEVHQMGIEFAKEIGHQAVIASHLKSVIERDIFDHEIEKGKVKHNHIIMNAYRFFNDIDYSKEKNFKWNECKKTRRKLKKINDAISQKYGWSFILDTSRANFVKKEIRNFVEETYKNSDKYDQFISELKKKKDYQIIEDKGEIKVKTLKGFTVNLEEFGPQFRKSRIKNQFKNAFNFLKKTELFKEKELKNILKNYDSSKLFVALQMERTSVKDHGKKESEKELFYKTAFALDSPNKEALYNCYIKPNQEFEIFMKENDQYVYVGEASQHDLEKYFGYSKFQKLETFFDKVQDIYEAIIDFCEWDDNDNKPTNEEKYRKNVEYYTVRSGIRNDSYCLYHRYYNRSLLELFFGLILLVFFKVDIFEPVQYVVKKHPKKDVIYAKRDYKIQRLLDAMHIIRNENLKTKAELEDRIKLYGKQIGLIKHRMNYYQNNLENMQEIYELILENKSISLSDYENLFRKIELEELLEVKNLSTKTLQDDFIRRYLEIEEKRKRSEEDLNNAKKKYRDLNFAQGVMNRWEREKLLDASQLVLSPRESLDSTISRVKNDFENNESIKEKYEIYERFCTQLTIDDLLMEGVDEFEIVNEDKIKEDLLSIKEVSIAKEIPNQKSKISSVDKDEKSQQLNLFYDSDELSFDD